MNTDDDAPTTTDREFLLKDFEHFASSYAANESMGETRLNIFIGLITAVYGGVGFIGTRDDEFKFDRDVANLALAATVFLLFIGLVFLLRVIRRNRVTNGYLHALKTIRRHCVEPGLRAEIVRELPSSPRRSFWNGGIAHIVAMLNSFISGVLGFLLMLKSGNPELGWLVAGFAAVVVFGVQHRLISIGK